MFPINSKDRFLPTLKLLSSVPINSHFLRSNGTSKKTVAFLPCLHAYKRESCIIPVSHAERQNDIHTYHTHIIPVGIFVYQCQSACCLIRCLGKVIGCMRVEQTENILLFQYVRTIQVIVCHRAQSRCSLKFGISVQICNVYV